MKRAVYLILLALVLITLSTSFIGCGGDSTKASGDQIDETPNPLVDDDMIPGDDDTGGDDDTSGDDDTGDDDTGADDDTGGDDDTGDDDTTDKPSITVTSPQDGSYFSVNMVDVVAEYSNIDEDTLAVSLDGNNITGSLAIADGNITGQITGLDDGDHVLNFYGSQGSDEVDLDVMFVIGLDPAHLIVSLSANEIITGEYVDVSYTFYDESGADITDTLAFDITVVPDDSVTVDDDRIWFYKPGAYTVTVGTLYASVYYTANAYLYVSQGEVYSLTIELSDYEIAPGETVFATATIEDENGDPVYAEVRYSVDPPFGATVNGDEITLTRAGVSLVRGNVVNTSVWDEVEIEVTAGTPVELNLYCDQPSVELGGSVNCAVEVIDNYGNVINAAYYYEVAPSTGVVVNGDQITFSADGYFVITAHLNGAPTIQDQAVVQVVDNTPPDIVFTSPTRGLYTHTGSLNVTGFVYDVNPSIAEMTLNGEAVYVAPTGPTTGSFETTYSLENGLNILEAQVSDGTNTAKASTSVLYGQAEWPNDSIITDAMGLRISELGFDQIEMIIERFLVNLDIEEVLMSMNPIFDEKVEVWGVTIASAKATVLGADYETPWVQFDAQETYLTTTAGIPRIEVFLKVRGSILGIGYTIEGDVEATAVTMSTSSAIWVENGTVLVDVGNFDVNIGGFNMDISGFPDELEDLFEDAMRAAIESVAEDQISQLVEPLLQDLMSQIPYSFDFAVGDANFTFAANPSEFTLDGDGGTFWMGARVLTDTINPIVPTFDGSIKTTSTRPTFDTYIPGTSEEYGFGIALSDDILNQILYQVFRSGMLTVDFPEVFNACDTVINLVFPVICDTYGDVPLTVKVRPLLPPVMVMDPVKTGFVDTEIQMGDLLIHLYTDDGGEDLVLTIAASVILPATFTHDYETNTLSVEFDTPEVVVDTVSNPLDLNETLFEDLAPVLVELLTPLLSEAFSNFELPGFDGWIMQMQQMMIVGANLDYMGIYASVIPEP